MNIFGIFKQVFNKSFLMMESLCVGAGLNLPENEAARIEVTIMADKLLQNGLSIVARDIVKNQIVGHAINTFEVLDENNEKCYFVDKACFPGTCPSTVEFCTFDTRVDLLRVHGVDCLFDIIMLGVMPGYAGAGIGRHLCTYSLELAQRLKNGECFEHVSDEIRKDGRRPQVISGVFTSAYSQRIAERLGFVANGSVRYDEKSFNGKTYAESINDAQHLAAVVMSKRL